MTTADEARVVRKAMVRLLPLLLIAYLAAYINRVNIGFAPTMREDLGLSASIFGLGAGLFFFGYFLFEVPSNLLLARIGARRWIFRIMVTWGLLSMAMALVRGPASFMLVRALLGVAEAGFFPGVLLYITFWFPAAWRARIIAWFMMAIPLSLAITGPVSNLAMQTLGGLFGLKDWQWLFIAEGAPTVILAFVILFTLPDRPAEARWLSDGEKALLQGALDDERARIEARHKPKSLIASLTDPRTLALSFVYFTNITSSYGLGFFLPQIIGGLGVSDTMANYLAAIPFLVGVAGILLFGEISDRLRQRRRGLLVLAAGLTALGLGGAAAMGASWASIAFLGLAVFGTYGAKAPFWPLPSMFLTGSAAAGGIALINATGNLGGFVGPYMVGWTRDLTGGYSAGLYLLAGLAVAGAVVAQLLKTPSHVEPTDSEPKEAR